MSISLFTGLDVLSADALYEIARSGAAPVSWLYNSPRKSRAWQPVSVAAAYGIISPLKLSQC